MYVNGWSHEIICSFSQDEFKVSFDQLMNVSINLDSSAFLCFCVLIISLPAPEIIIIPRAGDLKVRVIGVEIQS